MAFDVSTYESNFKQVEIEAKQFIVEAKGAPNDEEWVLNMSTRQFAEYRGKSFIWLLQNDVGYTAMLMADAEMQRGIPSLDLAHFTMWLRKPCTCQCQMNTGTTLGT